jgi:uncharacterized protein YjeT (DUF2065 family)
MLAVVGGVLVIEGLMPLIAPNRWREAMQRLGALRDGQLRFMGLASVVLGAVLLGLAG